MKKSDWKAYAKELEDENELIFEKYENLKNQLSTQKEANNIAVGENATLVKSYDFMEKHYNSHMEIAEKEIKRLNIIINYLEVRNGEKSQETNQ